MSDSESDLEFESADEGLKGEDIDTDDLIEDDDNVEETKPKRKPVTQATEIIKEKETSSPVAQDNKEKIDDTRETKSLTEVKTQVKEDVESEKREGWDADAELSDLEDEQKEVPETKPVNKADQQKPVVDNAKKEVSGWDADADFSDIEDNDEETPIAAGKEETGWDVDAEFSDVGEEEKNTKPQARQAVEEPKVKDIRNIGLFNQMEPKKEESSWSGGWGSFGSNFLSTATSLTSHLNKVMETVEATIGAPDPSQLAKLNLEETEALKAKRAESKSENKTQNDWIEEDEGTQEWFSMVSTIHGSLIYIDQILTDRSYGLEIEFVPNLLNNLQWCFKEN